MSEWISVKDKLPELDQEVLYTDGKYNNIYLGVRTLGFKGDFYWTHYDHLKDRGITHWMPLPKLPEIKDE